MDTTYADFWPDDIKPSVQSPLAILQPRADELSAKTKGILQGRVSTTAEKTWLFHNLDVVVPSLDDFRQRILTVKHQDKLIYPAYVDAEVFEKSLSQLSQALSLTRYGGRAKPPNEASTDDELIVLLKQALHSDQIKSILVSLIALANDATAKKLADATAAPESTKAEPQQ